MRLSGEADLLFDLGMDKGKASDPVPSQVHERINIGRLQPAEDGDRRACDDARDTYAEMQQIIPSIPYEPEDD